MPAALAIAQYAIPAAASVAGGVIGSRANNRASRMQQQSGREALDFAKEQEATRQKERAEQMAMEKAQWDAREQRRAEILGRYGRRYAPKPYAGAQSGTMPSGSGSTFGAMYGNSPTTARRPTTFGGMYGG